MDVVKEKAFEKLAQNLEDLVKLYRHLLDICRKEKEALIQQQKELKALSMSTSGHQNLIEWYKYAQSDVELVARSFAQYAANKTGNKEALKAIKKDAKEGKQWTEADFKEIYNAYEEIFTKKGVLR